MMALALFDIGLINVYGDCISPDTKVITVIQLFICQGLLPSKNNGNLTQCDALSTNQPANKHMEYNLMPFTILIFFLSIFNGIQLTRYLCTCVRDGDCWVLALGP